MRSPVDPLRAPGRIRDADEARTFTADITDQDQPSGM